MNQTASKAGRREWIALGVLLLPVLLVSMDLTVLYFAVPSITVDLTPTSAEQLWMIDIYGFVLAGLLITMGTLGDRIGRRLLLLIGAVAFGAGSIAGAFAGTPEMLIAARALQGIGGATLMPSTLALIRNMFHDKQQRRTAVAIWSSGMAAGAALGPVVSGALLNSFHWGSIFLINVPVMIVLLVLAPILLPEFRAIVRGRFDVLSAVLSLAAVLPLIYGFKKVALEGFDVVPVSAIALGLILGAIFVRRQFTRPNPMIDIQLFRHAGIGPSIAANMLASFSLVGFSLFTTQYMQSVLGMRPLESALWTIPGTFAVGAVVPVATVLVRKIRPAIIIGTGFLVALASFALLTQTPPSDGLLLLLVGIIGLAVGLTPVLTLVTEMVVGNTPPEQAGSASALLQTGQEFGAAVGIAVLGSIGATVYSHSGALAAPAGVPEAATDAARETIGSAVSQASQLGGDAGSTLLDAARTAFTEELQVAAVAGGIVMALAAVFSFIMLRHIKSDSLLATTDVEVVTEVQTKEEAALVR